MTSTKSSKKNPLSLWTPCHLCPCCGKFVILLRLPAFGSKTDPRWKIACYFKGWDGNPWFVSGGRFGSNATPHPRKRYAQRMYPRVEKKESDPFFSLDV